MSLRFSRSATEHLFDRAVDRLTYNDLVRMPEDLLRHELTDGVHFARRGRTMRHQLVLGNLLLHLHRHPVTGDRLMVLSGVDIVFTPFDVLNPDATYVSDARQREVLAEEHYIGPPDIVIEVLSEDTRERDLGTKREVYEKFGVPEYWLVDPDNETVILRSLGEPLLQSCQTVNLTEPLLLP